MEQVQVTEKSLDLINQGNTLMPQEKYQEALDKFEAAMEDSPKYVECYINIGNARACLEDYKGALEAFRKGLMLDPDSSEILFDIGNIYNLMGDNAQAVTYYNRADEKGGLNDDMYDILAQVYMENNDSVQALRYINKAISINPLKGEYYLEKAGIFIDEDKVAEAEETLKEMHKMLPDAYDAYDLLCEIYLKKGDFQSAITLAEEGCKRFEKDGNLANLKLRVLVAFDKFEDALAYIDEIRNSEIYEERRDDNAQIEAEIYLKQNKVEKALDVLESACDEDYSNTEIAYLLSSLYLKMGENDKVLHITEKMMSQDLPMFYDASAVFYHAQANEFAGNIEESQKEFSEIVKIFRRMTILEPSFFEGYAYRLLAHKSLKQYDEALELADYMLNVFPDRPDGHVYKYIIYQDMNNTEEAEKEKAKALELDPGFAF